MCLHTFLRGGRLFCGHQLYFRHTLLPICDLEHRGDIKGDCFGPITDLFFAGRILARGNQENTHLQTNSIRYKTNAALAKTGVGLSGEKWGAREKYRGMRRNSRETVGKVWGKVGKVKKYGGERTKLWRNSAESVG